VINRVRTWWEGLTRNNQIILVASTLGVLISLIGFVSWASTPEYVPLFSDLSAQDASAITDKLREQNVPYRLTRSGTGVEVPSQKRDELRMKLLSEGLPHQGSVMPGYELLDKAGSFMTPPQESQMLLRAREGEVSKTIMSLEQVAAATVHYAAENDSPFVSERKPPSASVIVTLKPGQSLSKENVRAIVRLSQMPYTGLNEKNISVIDSSGNVLWDGPRTDAVASDENMEKQRAYAQERRMELQSVLDNTIGAGKSVVLVNAELNFDQETKESVLPEVGVATSKTTATETMSGKGSISNRPAGATANVAGATPATPGVPTYQMDNQNENGSYKREETTTAYQPGTTKTVTQKAPMHVDKLTVSAMVDANVKGANNQALDLGVIKKVLETYIGANGTDTSRVVTVESFPFDRSSEVAAEKAATAARSAEMWSKIFSIALPLALMLICFILLARALKRAAPVPAGQLALPGGGFLSGGMAYGVDGSSAVLGPDGTPLPGQTVDDILSGDSPIGLPSGVNGPKTYDVIEEAFDANLESILHLARSKPETVAALIKTWTNEE
jgi:flagellar M-ring protein FliF